MFALEVLKAAELALLLVLGKVIVASHAGTRFQVRCEERGIPWKSLPNQ